MVHEASLTPLPLSHMARLQTKELNHRILLRTWFLDQLYDKGKQAHTPILPDNLSFLTPPTRQFSLRDSLPVLLEFDNATYRHHCPLVPILQILYNIRLQLLRHLTQLILHTGNTQPNG